MSPARLRAAPGSPAVLPVLSTARAVVSPDARRSTTSVSSVVGEQSEGPPTWHPSWSIGSAGYKSILIPVGLGEGPSSEERPASALRRLRQMSQTLAATQAFWYTADEVRQRVRRIQDERQPAHPGLEQRQGVGPRSDAADTIMVSPTVKRPQSARPARPRSVVGRRWESWSEGYRTRVPGTDGQPLRTILSRMLPL